MSDSRPKTKKLRNATPNINLPIINSASNKFNWKTLSESNVYILKKLPEVSLKESSLNQLERIEFGEHQKGRKKKEFLKQNSSSSLGKVKAHANSENLIKHRAATIREHSGGHPRPTTNQKMQVLIKCYLCNQQFNGKEIIKHEAECLERWRQLSSEEKRKAIEEQKQWLNDTSDSAATPTSEGDLNSADDTHGQWKKFKAILRSCSKCSRNFFEHRLERHEANCKGKQAPVSKTTAENYEDNLANSPDRSNLKETLRDRNDLQENIVFVRKTKPLNSRSTQLYKQQQAGTSSPPGLSFESSSEFRGDSRGDSQSSNGDLSENEKNNASNPKTSTTNYFMKCPQCGRVLNKANFQTHEKYHARSISLSQPPDDKDAQDSRTDPLSFNGLSLDGSSPLSPVNSIDVNADRADAINLIHATNTVKSELPSANSGELSKNLNGINEQDTKAKLIVQLSKQFNPINQTNQSNRAASQPLDQLAVQNVSPANQTSPSDQPKTSNQHSNGLESPIIDNQLMFNEDEWSEHLSKLKKCDKCDRTFFANRIKKHQSICKAKKVQAV